MRVRKLLFVVLVVATFRIGLGQNTQPNIVVMMADDMGMGDTSAYQDFTGNANDVQVWTPNMERLARMGVRFTDAHTPSSRCSTTRYGLLTGRYSWRNRLKHWVLFGVQGDPMIELDRPTVASMLREQGYHTGMVGKWHLGLRYRQSDGNPAAGWEDADLTQPMFTSPLDHGFDFARYTSRSHGTSGPDAGAAGQGSNQPLASTNQQIGPGHIHGRTVIGATGDGKRLISEGPDAYVLTELGSRHSESAMEFLANHVSEPETKSRPFFLYYPANSNHSPYTPDDAIGGSPVKGAARTKSGRPMDARHDFIYENDVALGRLMDWLQDTEDPRNPGKTLLENTLVIFTSDNGAEKDSDIATGPFRSHKGSVYEGGHRVPFIAAWKSGSVGDGNLSTPGISCEAPIGLQDLYATFAEIVGAKLPDLRQGEKGAEDSFSVLGALRGNLQNPRPPLFFNDHKEAQGDPAAAAMRIDTPYFQGKTYPGKWKIFFDAALLRAGVANAVELYNLESDQWESKNLINEIELIPLVEGLTRTALHHRNAGGHRLAAFAPEVRLNFDWRDLSETGSSLARTINLKPQSEWTIESSDRRLKLTMRVASAAAASQQDPNHVGYFRCDELGLGIDGNSNQRVDAGEAVSIQFDQDVIVDSVSLFAGEGACGGFYQVADKSPLDIYCIDADLEDKDQSGILSDIGVLKAGQELILNSSPHFGVESPGAWQLQSMAVRILE